MKKWNLYWGKTAKSLFRNVDKERITIGSCLADWFGLRILWGCFFEDSLETVRKDILYLCIVHEFGLIVQN